MSYATVPEFAAYLGTEAPENAAWLLDRASVQVDALVIGAIYEVDTDEMPTDTVIRAALRRATCEQAYFLSKLKDATGASDQYQSHSWSLGQASESYTLRSSAGTTVTKSYSDHTVEILRVAGLLPPYVVSAGW